MNNLILYTTLQAHIHSHKNLQRFILNVEFIFIVDDDSAYFARPVKSCKNVYKTVYSSSMNLLKLAK